MINYRIETTFGSDDGSVSTQSQSTYQDNEQAPFSDEAPNDSGESQNEVDDLELLMDYEFEHTLSEHELKAAEIRGSDSAEDNNTVEDNISADDHSSAEALSDIESEAEELVKKERSLSKKVNFLGLLSIVLILIIVILAALLGSRNKNASKKSGGSYITQANSALAADSSALAESTDPLSGSTNATTVAPTGPPTSTASPSSSPTETDFMSIYDMVCSTDGLETLCALIAEACTSPGLEDTCETLVELRGEGPFTVFAPNNSAFEMVSMSLKLAIQDPEFLNAILFYHVVEGEVLVGDLACDSTVTMANAEVTTTTCDENGDFYQSGPGNVGVPPKIIRTDVNARIGVVHVIDQVILPDADHFLGNEWYRPNGIPRPWDNFFEDEEENENSDADLCQDEVHVTKPCYIVGESIEISYKSCSPGVNDWLGVFRTGSVNGRTQRMQERSVYWELPCGGQGTSCDNPADAGTIAMDSRVGPGRYQVYSISNMNRPQQSNSASETFVVARRCNSYLASIHGATTQSATTQGDSSSPESPSNR